MTARFDLADPDSREAGLTAAVSAVRRGQLVVLPTDTVYGVGVVAHLAPPPRGGEDRDG